MTFGVRTKVFGVSLLLVACVGLTTGPLLESRLRAQLEAEIEQEHRRHVRTARELLQAVPQPTSLEEADRWADRLGSTTECRVTIIAPDGTVRGDSQLDVEQVRTIDNHGDRPEVRAALTRGVGISRRYSKTLRVQMLYVAVPLERAGQPAGVVRVAVPLSDVDAAVGQLRLLLVAVSLVGLVVAVLVSGVASQLLTRRLRVLVERLRAQRRSHDGSPRPPPVTDEVGHLAGSFSRMESELQAVITKLSGERDRLETILEGMTDAVVALDEKDRVALVNPEALSLLGFEEAPIGRPLDETIDVPALAAIVERSRSGIVASAEFELPGEPPRRVLARAARLRMTGGSVLVMQDVSEMRRLETIRRDFVANVSHELRTPVSIIRANAETLLDGALEDPSGRGFVEAIERNAQRLTALIADLLDLSRIEAGSYRLDIGPVRLADTFARAVEAVDELSRRRDVSVTVALDPDMAVLADSGGLDQMVLNLLDNAVKYSHDGGSVELRAKQQGTTVRIEVEDDGPGIDPRYRDRVFERFYRVDRGRSREAGGTGLGLAIVKHLADAMGGDVGLEQGAQRGSRFWVRLPAAS